MQSVLTITLNPAIDYMTSVAKMVPEGKLRCEKPRLDPGGGGVNISRMIKELGGESTALIAIGGGTGVLMRELIDQAGIDAVFLETGGMTRQSFAIRDRSTSELFRIVLPGPEQESEFTERALGMVSKLLASRPYDYVVASGTLLPGVASDFYGRVREIVVKHSSRFILDTSGEALVFGIGQGLFLVKADVDEARILGSKVVGDPEEAEYLAQIILSRGAKVAIITLGADGALVATRDKRLRIRPPKVKVVSPIGAGDSFVGALTFALVKGWSIFQAAAYGVAAAAAAVTTEATELAHKSDVDRLYDEIKRHQVIL